jgi:hypothetical protein
LMTSPPQVPRAYARDYSLRRQRPSPRYLCTAQFSIEIVVIPP